MNQANFLVLVHAFATSNVQTFNSMPAQNMLGSPLGVQTFFYFCKQQLRLLQGMGNVHRSQIVYVSCSSHDKAMPVWCRRINTRSIPETAEWPG